MDMTVAGLTRAYRSGELTPDLLIEQILQRCAHYTDWNIWIYRLTRAELEPYIAALRTKSPQTLPLYGIPFAIKDNIDLAGIPTTAACAAYTYIPRESALVVQHLIEAGAIPVGKTNMDQFATGLVGTRSPWGACRNAFNPKYISGGSSSGSAVATALGLVSFALGTDTAGSGRVPAAFNNIIGVKPTRGIISLRGVVPACRSLDCVSLFALTSDDANTVLHHMTGFDTQDPYARPLAFNNNHRHYGMPLGEFSFGVPAASQLEFFGDHPAQRLFNTTVARFEALGGKKQIIDFTAFQHAAQLLYDGPWLAERYVAIESIITAQPGALLPVINTIIAAAVKLSATDTFKAFHQLQYYRTQTDTLLRNFDFLLTPTSGTIYTIDQIHSDPIGLNRRLGYYTNFMNLLDYAAIALPAGFLDNGLPWGITLTSHAMQDRKLLGFANRWQQVLQLPLGATQSPLPPSRATPITLNTTVPVVVCGAHLDGLALNWQLRERGALLAEKTTTAKAYRFYALAGGPPYRPGLIRDAHQGAMIEVEVWDISAQEFGGFVAAIPAPLGMGKIELADGRWLPGFICEAYAVLDAQEITSYGGWRRFIADKT
ncbi:MAG: allophanate hydrolase [Gammaproteobacteria bacterium]|nr:allophanate hydrolase [Gammaproteobacteria bacterium]